MWEEKTGGVYPNPTSISQNVSSQTRGGEVPTWEKFPHFPIFFLPTSLMPKQKKDLSLRWFRQDMNWTLLRSGDLVAIDNENFHSIVGREKDLIITAGGENIAPQPIHDLVKEQLPVISQVLLLGDKQKFVSCFLTLAVEVDTETMEPTGKLSSAARDWVEAQGSNATTVQEVIMMS